MEFFIVFWLVCGCVAALIADSKGGSGFVGFIVGLLLGPLGVVISFFLGSEDGLAQRKLSAGQKKKCPQCAELVQPEARVCRFCAHDFGDAALPAAPVPAETSPNVFRPEVLGDDPASREKAWTAGFAAVMIVLAVGVLLYLGAT